MCGDRLLFYTLVDTHSDSLGQHVGMLSLPAPTFVCLDLYSGSRYWQGVHTRTISLFALLLLLLPA
jgi:hypothetical protein